MTRDREHSPKADMPSTSSIHKWLRLRSLAIVKKRMIGCDDLIILSKWTEAGALLVMEQADAGEGHYHTVLFCRLYDIFIAH